MVRTRSFGMPASPPGLDRSSRRDALLAALVAGVALATALLPRLAQDPAYHAFADRRALAGVPNALDVLSNAAFVVVGALGLWAVRRPGAFADPVERAPWRLVFLAVVATGAGSAWYHLAPDSARLVWDRLPMAVGFMALLSALVCERIGAAAGRQLLGRLVLLGVASVAYWWATELRGAGNLLPYVVVQVVPLAAIPALVAVGRPRATSPYWLAALGLYLVAKGFEAADEPVFAALGVSGHTLKHLAAAAGIAVLVAMLRRRRTAT